MDTSVGSEHKSRAAPPSCDKGERKNRKGDGMDLALTFSRGEEKKRCSSITRSNAPFEWHHLKQAADSLCS